MNPHRLDRHITTPPPEPPDVDAVLQDLAHERPDEAAVVLEHIARLEGERAAVVAWLRECAMDPDATGAEMRLLQEHAGRIERGEHRGTYGGAS